MKKEDLICYEGKKIKVILKNGYIYTCDIVYLSDDCFKIKDKFENMVLINYDNIKLITEIGNRGGENV